MVLTLQSNLVELYVQDFFLLSSNSCHFFLFLLLFVSQSNHWKKKILSSSLFLLPPFVPSSLFPFFFLFLSHLFSPSSFFLSLSFIRYSLNSTAIIVVIIMIIILAMIPKVINPTGSPSSLFLSISLYFSLFSFSSSSSLPSFLSHTLVERYCKIERDFWKEKEKKRERDGHVIR